ncbi:MAG TPA: 1,2-phenylacetyl-CoA epoxidase subunit PaaC [bacterium]|nr:1,2-phenylacetyl-CoA epoxidase subunit PaaC [bacterium]
MPGTLAAIADPAVREAFREWLLRMADDELVIGHRHSEWTGVGPDIESDVAMSSIAQEELGHARALYEQIAEDEGSDADRLAFGRAAGEYRHAALLEQENEGWEYSIVRLVLYETFEVARLRLVAASGQEPVAGLAQLLTREERYHALFGETWLRRLAGGAPDGPERIQAAVDKAWPDALGLFEATPADALLQHAGVLRTSPGAECDAWVEAVRPVLEGCGLRIPTVTAREGGRRGVHTPAFEELLAQMTEVWRSDPEARW